MLTHEEFEMKVRAVAELMGYTVTDIRDHNAAIIEKGDLRLWVATPIPMAEQDVLIVRGIYPLAVDGKGSDVDKVSVSMADGRSPEYIKEYLEEHLLPDYTRKLAVARVEVAERNGKILARRKLLESVAEAAGEEVSYASEVAKLSAFGYVNFCREHGGQVEVDSWDTCSIKLSRLNLAQVLAIVKVVKGG